MELEIKHIAPYIPYGLKMQYEGIINRKELSAYKKTEPKCELLESLNKEYLDWVCKHPNQIIGVRTSKIKEIKFFNNCISYSVGTYHGYLKNVSLSEIKPILLPLSEFEDIESVKEYIGLGNWCAFYDNFFNAWLYDADNVDKLVLQAPYEIAQYFFENHYDFFSLIPNGLAIDINTITNERPN